MKKQCSLIAIVASLTLISTGTAAAEPEWDSYSPTFPASWWLFAEQVASQYEDRSLDAGECTDYTYIGVPGTSETNEARDPDSPAGRYVGAFGLELEKENVRPVWVPYPSRAVSTSYSESMGIGQATTIKLMETISEACPDTQYLLAGYSQGADAITGVLESIAAGNGPVAEDKVARAVLLANPSRWGSAVDYHGTAKPDGQGLLATGPPEFGSMEVVEICNEGDVWCDSAPTHRIVGPVATNPSLSGAVGIAGDVIRSETLWEDLDEMVRFALNGSALHIDYENVSADGSLSMAQWALEYLRGGIS